MINKQLYTLADLTTQISYGYTASASDQEVGPKFLRITDIQNGIVNWDSVPFCKIPNSMLDKYLLKYGDIVVARTGNSTGENYIYTGTLPTVFASYLIRMSINTSLADPFFLWYQMRSSSWWHFISCNKAKSAQSGANATTLAQFVIKLPPMAEQKKISAILSFLDEKIEINSRINAELEVMAKTLYDYWFVQFDFPDKNGKFYKASGGKVVFNLNLKREIPSGWNVRKIGDALEVVLGGTPSTSNADYWENGVFNWLSSGEMNAFPIIQAGCKITKEALNNSATKLMPSGSIAISITRYIRPTILAIDSCANQSVVGVYESSTFKKSYLYPFFVNEVSRYMKIRTGAMQPHINKETIKETLIIEPPSQILSKYYEIANPIYQMIINNAKENLALVQLRDWLLPLLMNGQITVA